MMLKRFSLQIVELNTFFLKHIFRIPNPHPLNLCRLILISVISAPTIRQYYIFVTDNRSKRLGTQCWVFIAITTVELLICIKFGTELFAKTELRNVALWLLFQLGFSFLLVCWMILRRKRNVVSEEMESDKEKNDILDKLPSDESTKVYNYVRSNGEYVVRRDKLNPRPSAMKSSARVTRSMAKGSKRAPQDLMTINDVPNRRKSNILWPWKTLSFLTVSKIFSIIIHLQTTLSQVIQIHIRLKRAHDFGCFVQITSWKIKLPLFRLGEQRFLDHLFVFCVEILCWLVNTLRPETLPVLNKIVCR